MKTSASRGHLDPEAAQRYHLLIVGGGTVGLAAARYAAELGARVAVVERHRLGGDRLTYVLPSVRLIRATRALRATSDAVAPLGHLARTADDVDYAEVLRGARGPRPEDARRTGTAYLCRLGIDIFTGSGRFVAADALEVGRRRLRFRRALIATGSRAVVPQIPGLEEAGYRTPETLFTLDQPPRRLAVLGAGARGCEMAQAFARLGSEVHLFEPRGRILHRCDPVAADRIEQALRGEVHLHLETTIQRLRSTGESKLVIHTDGPTKSTFGRTSDRQTAVDEILIAVGEAPNVERLGLEAAGVDYDLSGVDVGRRLRTTNRRIFAAGGVIAGSGFEHVDSAARLAVRNALFVRRLVPQRPTTARAVLTAPEVAWVGLDAEEAAAGGRRIETLTVPLNDAIEPRPENMLEEFLRLYLGRRSGRIVGGTLVAANAAELIAPLALAVRHKMRLRPFAADLVPYPADGNVYRRAAADWRRRHKSRARALLELFFKWSSWSPR